MVFALYFCPNHLVILNQGLSFCLQKLTCINNFFIKTKCSFITAVKEIHLFWSMWLSWSLFIKDDGNAKKPEGWQRASMGQLPGDWGLAPVSEWSWHHWVVTTWSENRTEKSETENHRSASACAMLFLLAGGDDNSFTSGMDFVLVKQSHLRFRLHSMSPRCSTAFSVKVPLSCWLLRYRELRWLNKTFHF